MEMTRERFTSESDSGGREMMSGFWMAPIAFILFYLLVV